MPIDPGAQRVPPEVAFGKENGGHGHIASPMQRHRESAGSSPVIRMSFMPDRASLQHDQQHGEPNDERQVRGLAQAADQSLCQPGARNAKQICRQGMGGKQAGSGGSAGS